MLNTIDPKALSDVLDEHAIVSATDATGNITYINQKFIDISGYTESELLGQNHRILKSGIHTPEFYQQLWDTLASGKTWHGEVCNRRKSGALYWVRSSVKPILDGNGLPVQYISIRTDITEIKQAEDNSHRSQVLMRSVIDAIPDLIFFKDKDGKYLGCNQAFEQYFDSPEALIIGKTDFDFVDDELATFFRKMDAKMLASGKSLMNEELLTYPDGRKANVEVLKTPYNYGDASSGVIGIGHDITARKAAEKQLQLFREMVEHTGQPIFLLDVEDHYRLVYANKAAMQHWGASKEELLTWLLNCV